MKKALMIIFYFPPLGGSGVHRPLKFTKYLSDFEWEPIILTVNEKRSQDSDDSTLLEELPKSIKIYRSGYIGLKELFPFLNKKEKAIILNSDEFIGYKRSFLKKLSKFTNTLLIPDPKIGWYPLAMRKAKRIFQENTIDIIYSTSPFPTAHLIAMSLAKKYCKPWVADFRDPWTKFFYVKRPFPFKQFERLMEKKVLKNADKIIIAWPGIQDNFILQYNADFCSKTILIHNGYDEKDFQNISPKTFSKFTIVHTGVFYKERTPEALFKALAFLFTKEPMLRKDIQVIQIGPHEPIITDLIRENNLYDVVQTIPYLPHKKCLSYLLGADVLFLNTVQNHVPGKMFEYMRSKKPILSLTSYDKTVSEIVNSTQAGIVVDPLETEKIKETIFEMYEKHKKGELKLEREDDSIIYQYERKNLTGELAKIFNEVIEKN